MVMTSQQIAAQVGAFQQQSMYQMQHAGMLSQFAGARNPQMQAGQMMGAAMNTAGAIGQPMIQGGMALAGVDPMTMGLRAAWAARSGGFMAAGGAGLAAGAAVGAPLMAAQYAGTQMFQGAHQQQQLNRQLGTFQFANQYGGRGFTSGENRGIGQMMRQMSSQRGPGGEFATMDELGRLASNMGRMGMAQGVRNAKDFRDKFQQMMRTVKEVATQLSTSLEEAQKTMAAMKGSGVFGASNQKMAAGMMREGVVAGGRTQMEMAQIANIGSQMSRAVGGRGRAGAMAGMEALTRASAALRAGVISEEDLYDQTGQTGAAGLQALAAQNVQGDLSWFKKNQGRIFLAAVAGKNGTINKDAVNKILSGELSTGETMAMAQRNLAKIGRADFIRNEGRLRGEAAAAFGGNARVTMMRQWMKTRGISPDSMDDRNMLFMQRQLGMDRDEADNAMKMLKGQGRMNEFREQSMEEDKFMRSLEASNKYKGLEGVKRKLEEAKKKINDSLRQAGADFYSGGQNMIEGFINRITGRFVGTIDRDLTKTVHEVMRGGSYGQHLAATRLGVSVEGQRGLGLIGADSGYFAGDREAIFGGGTRAGSNLRFARLNEGRYKEAGWNIVNNRDINAERRRVDPDAIRRHGYSKSGVFDRMERIRRIGAAVNETDEEAAAYGASLSKEFRSSAIHGGGQGRGQAALENFGNELGRMAAGGNRQALAMYERYQNASDEERARIMGSMRAGAGRSRGGEQLAEPQQLGLFESGKFATEQDLNRAIGAYSLAGAGTKAGYFNRQRNLGRVGGALAGAAVGAAAGSFLLPGIGTAAGAVIGAGVGYFAGGAAADAATGSRASAAGNSKVQAAYGRLMRSEDGRRMAEMVLSRDGATRESALDALASRNEQLMAAAGHDYSKMSDEAKADYELNRTLAATASVNALAAQYGGDPMSIPEGEWKKLQQRTGMGRDELEARVGALAAVSQEKQDDAMKQYGVRAGTIARDRMAQHRERGIVKAGKLTDKAMAGLEGVGQLGPSSRLRKQLGIGETDERTLGELALQSLVSADTRRAGMTGDPNRDRTLEGLAQRDQQDFEKLYREMSSDDRKGFMKQLREKGFTEKADELESRDASKDRLQKGFTKELEAKKGGGFKKGSRFTRESFYSNIAKELGIEGMDYKPGQKGKSAQDMQDDLYKKLTGGMSAAELEGVDLGSVRSISRKLERARQTGDIEAAAEATSALRRTGITEARDTAKQNAEATATDPTYRALTDIQKALGKNLKVTVTNASEIGKDPEGKEPPGP